MESSCAVSAGSRTRASTFGYKCHTRAIIMYNLMRTRHELNNNYYLTSKNILSTNPQNVDSLVNPLQSDKCPRTNGDAVEFLTNESNIRIQHFDIVQ